MRLILAWLSLPFLVMFLGRDARAQTAPPPALPRGYHQHDGFYLHTDFGVAAASSKASAASSGNDFSFSGVGTAFGVAAGGSVGHNLIGFGEITGVEVENPTAKVNGQEVPWEVQPQSFSVIGVGPGVAYYVGPSNIFIGGSLLISWLRVLDADGFEQETEVGAGVTLKVGKEWWVSRNWALGALLGVNASSTKDADDNFGEPATWQNRSAFLSFSATFH